ncbi:hypothetical protein FOZ61_005739 [Perkinsus olseni]|uniref:CDT1 Geminin-binding domain-containing protein n=1 Tax=Perkinsus olseni TaxID=32597 RepID=A0A7J6LGN0_PEROL|nr:hypothetical protein FOZ61_005739 [Perkinsus olseni]
MSPTPRKGSRGSRSSRRLKRSEQDAASPSVTRGRSTSQKRKRESTSPDSDPSCATPRKNLFGSPSESSSGMPPSTPKNSRPSAKRHNSGTPKRPGESQKIDFHGLHVGSRRESLPRGRPSTRGRGSLATNRSSCGTRISMGEVVDQLELPSTGGKGRDSLPRESHSERGPVKNLFKEFTEKQDDDTKGSKLPAPNVATIGAGTKLPIPEELKKASPPVSAVKRSLPSHYKTVLDQFRMLDEVLSLFRTRSQVPYYLQLKAGVERASGKRFAKGRLLQVVFAADGLFDLEWREKECDIDSMGTSSLRRLVVIQKDSSGTVLAKRLDAKEALSRAELVQRKLEDLIAEQERRCSDPKKFVSDEADPVPQAPLAPNPFETEAPINSTPVLRGRGTPSPDATPQTPCSSLLSGVRARRREKLELSASPFVPVILPQLSEPMTPARTPSVRDNIRSRSASKTPAERRQEMRERVRAKEAKEKESARIYEEDLKWREKLNFLELLSSIVSELSRLFFMRGHPSMRFQDVVKHFMSANGGGTRYKPLGARVMEDYLRQTAELAPEWIKIAQSKIDSKTEVLEMDMSVKTKAVLGKVKEKRDALSSQVPYYSQLKASVARQSGKRFEKGRLLQVVFAAGGILGLEWREKECDITTGGSNPLRWLVVVQKDPSGTNITRQLDAEDALKRAGIVYRNLKDRLAKQEQSCEDPKKFVADEAEPVPQAPLPPGPLETSTPIKSTPALRGCRAPTPRATPQTPTNARLSGVKKRRPNELELTSSPFVTRITPPPSRSPTPDGNVRSRSDSQTPSERREELRNRVRRREPENREQARIDNEALKWKKKLGVCDVLFPMVSELRRLFFMREHASMRFLKVVEHLMTRAGAGIRFRPLGRRVVEDYLRQMVKFAPDWIKIVWSQVDSRSELLQMDMSVKTQHVRRRLNEEKAALEAEYAEWDTRHRTPLVDTASTTRYRRALEQAASLEATIPRKELHGLLQGAAEAYYLCSTLKLGKEHRTEVYILSDSLINIQRLSWLSGKSKEVASRYIGKKGKHQFSERDLDRLIRIRDYLWRCCIPITLGLLGLLLDEPFQRSRYVPPDGPDDLSEDFPTDNSDEADDSDEAPTAFIGSIRDDIRPGAMPTPLQQDDNLPIFTPEEEAGLDTDLQRLVVQDSFYGAIAAYLRDGSVTPPFSAERIRRVSACYQVDERNRLYRVTLQSPSGSIVRQRVVVATGAGRNLAYRLVVTKHIRWNHLGTKKLTARLSLEYFWKRMEASVRGALSTCLPCLRSNATRRFRSSAGARHVESLRPLMVVGIDLYLPGLKSHDQPHRSSCPRSDVTAILLITCAATGFIQACLIKDSPEFFRELGKGNIREIPFPANTQSFSQFGQTLKGPVTSSAICDCLDATFSSSITPSIVLSDNDGKFCASFAQKWCKARRVVHCFAPPYSPLLCLWERGHREVTRCLRSCINDSGDYGEGSSSSKPWHTLVLECVDVLNGSPYSSVTWLSPRMLVFPYFSESEYYSSNPSADDILNKMTAFTTPGEAKKVRDEARASYRLKLLDYLRHWSSYRETSRARVLAGQGRECNLQVADKVYHLTNASASSKLASRVQGPFQVDAFEASKGTAVLSGSNGSKFRAWGPAVDQQIPWPPVFTKPDYVPTTGVLDTPPSTRSADLPVDEAEVIIPDYLPL